MGCRNNKDAAEPDALKKAPDPETKEWWDLAADAAMEHCPPLYPCQHCGYPVVDGYCCGFCGSDDPGGYEEE